MWMCVLLGVMCTLAATMSVAAFETVEAWAAYSLLGVFSQRQFLSFGFAPSVL
jgi:hypothetical protein